MTEHARSGPSHPLCIAATGLLLLNDHVLKEAYANALTGKLSDVAWLIVAPVVVAAVLSLLRLSGRAAKRLALVGVAAAFVALQTWPPLGDAWTALFGGGHTPDLTDLFMLPALALAPLCWRRPPRPRVWALPLSACACVATSYLCDEDRRLPCDEETAWDYNRPLFLHWDNGVAAPRSDTPGFLSRVSLVDERGEAVPFVTGWQHNSMFFCVIGGLERETTYTWSVGPFGDASNVLGPAYYEHTGARTFTTSASSDAPVIESEEDCATMEHDVSSEGCEYNSCDDTGYYGDDTGYYTGDYAGSSSALEVTR